MPTSREERWNVVPVALLMLDADSHVLDANAEFLGLVGGASAVEVVGRRLSELLTVGGRIFWDTHIAPLLRVDGRVDEVAVELRTHDGREPVLLSAVERVCEDHHVIEVAMFRARERARFEHELVGARRAAEASERRVRALHSTAADLASVAGRDGVAWVLLRAAVSTLGAGDAALWLVEDDAALRRWGGAEGIVGPAPEELTGTSTRSAGAVVVPLRVAGALLGVLVLEPRRAASADPLDPVVLAAAGQQAALALARAALHEQSVSVAAELQRAMLDGALTLDPRVEVAAEYRPGVHELQVGGDWYDSYRVAPGRLALSVGDVVGRGLGAATAMGQLRTASRAVADSRAGPEQVLDRLDRFVENTGTGFMASLVYAQLDLDEGLLHYACAGHLPPLHVRADGTSAFLWDARSTPLGVRTAEPRASAAVQLARGDVVVLYTDGIVESRDRDLQSGLEVLLGAATDALVGTVDPALGLGALAERLVADAPEHDDSCVLALRWSGEPAREAGPDVAAQRAK
ncbi:SpoIIE family protein phosphatase [Cellulosimicrobium arenosum]|uniref:SpoIIE family protein phosphatase n=1 Tax=Cellulosimicrobium arenosum TaxID=2708133 RepID=A0A927PEM2_9MICO|nr:SpoIIE family protein phosphatase [Cellulosimicrobium arenosum]MBD8079744.1 SpoIIE family protein phosphatase [Cellulosimicrobium arenosum]